MTKKTKFSPKVKHKAFASFMVKLQDDDWMLGIFNPNDKTAVYFLAEPAVSRTSGKMAGSAPNKGTKISGYMLSALSRQGLLETTIHGLPRKFKTVEDATEWLEGQVEQYDGDEVIEVIADFKSDRKPQVDQFVKQIEYFATESVKDPGKAGAVTSKKKAVNKSKPATSQKNKYKTSKEELEALGLGELFDDGGVFDDGSYT